MSEAVTVPSLTMMTSTVSEEPFTRDTHTHTHTHTQTDRQTGGQTNTHTHSVLRKIGKVAYDFANKNKLIKVLSQVQSDLQRWCCVQ